MPAPKLSHESDSASRHRNMLKSLRVDVPHVEASMPAVGFVRQPPPARLCERRAAVMGRRAYGGRARLTRRRRRCGRA